MLTHLLPESTRDLLDRADVAFLNGNWPKGSLLLWQAYADTVGTIAIEYSMPYASDDDIHSVLQRAAMPEMDYYSLLNGFSLVQRFRDAAYGKGPEDYEVECLYPEVRFIVAELAALA